MDEFPEFSRSVLEVMRQPLEDRHISVSRAKYSIDYPAGIIKMLDLRRPIYKQTAAYGHFGRTDVDLPWEHLDKVETLKKYLCNSYE